MLQEWMKKASANQSSNLPDYTVEKRQRTVTEGIIAMKRFAQLQSKKENRTLMTGLSVYFSSGPVHGCLQVAPANTTELQDTQQPYPPTVKIGQSTL